MVVSVTTLLHNEFFPCFLPLYQTLGTAMSFTVCVLKNCFKSCLCIAVAAATETIGRVKLLNDYDNMHQIQSCELLLLLSVAQYFYEPA